MDWVITLSYHWISSGMRPVVGECAYADHMLLLQVQFLLGSRFLYRGDDFLFYLLQIHVILVCKLFRPCEPALQDVPDSSYCAILSRRLSIEL